MAPVMFLVYVNDIIEEVNTVLPPILRVPILRYSNFATNQVQ